MNKNKILKLAFITTTLVTATASLTTVISCGSSNSKPKPKPKNDWKSFVTAAQNENPYFIIANANPSAKGWDNLVENDVSFKNPPTPDDYYKTVTTVIASKSLNQIATFQVSYILNGAYSVKDWKCTFQPTTDDPVKYAWKVFKNAAMNDDFTNIIKNSDLANQSWKNITDNHDLTGTPKIDEANKTITLDMTSISLQETATFMITFTTKIFYQDTKWKCIVAPHPSNSWSHFKSQALDSNPKYIVDNSDLDNDQWKALSLNDLSFQSPISGDDNTKTLTTTIRSTSLIEDAVFKITFVAKTEYKDTQWKCTTKPYSVNNWDNFKIDALADNAFHIYKNSDISNWDQLSSDDFKIRTKVTPDDSKKTLTTEIEAVSLHQVATFVITYVSGTTYENTKWKCTVLPHDGNDWNHFKTQAEADSASNIVKHSDLDNPNWKPSSDLSIYTKAIPDKDDHSLTVVIKSFTYNQIATFKISFATEANYDKATWICTIQPHTIPNFKI